MNNMDDMYHQEHMRWVRLECFTHAREMMPNGLVEDVIIEAQKIEQFVSGRPSNNVVKLVKGRPSNNVVKLVKGRGKK